MITTLASRSASGAPTRSRSMRSGRTRSRSANRRWRRRLALRAYRRGDELAFTARMDMGDELVRVGWNWARGAPGPTWALIRSETGEVVGFGGGVEQRRGDWELWCVLAPLAWRDWPSAVQCAREVVRALVKDWKARRMTL